MILQKIDPTNFTKSLIQQEPRINDKIDQSHVLQKLNMQMSLNKSIMQTQQQMKVTSPIQRQIHNIVSPVRVPVVRSIIDQNVKFKQIQQYSMMKYFAQLYSQIMTQLIDSSTEKNPLTNQQVQIGDKKISQILTKQINLMDDKLEKKLSKLIQYFREHQTLFRKYCMICVNHVITSAKKMLQWLNYCINPSTANLILLNENCISFDHADDQNITKTQSIIITSKIRQFERRSTNVNTMSLQIIKKQMQKKVQAQKQQMVWQKWDMVSDKDFKNPKSLMLKTMTSQISMIEAHQSKFRTKMDQEIQKLGKKNL